MQGSAGSTPGEFAFHRREDALDDGSAAIQLAREVLPHLTRTPVARREVKRLAGMTLPAPSCWRQKLCFRHFNSGSFAVLFLPDT